MQVGGSFLKWVVSTGLAHSFGYTVACALHRLPLQKPHYNKFAVQSLLHSYASSSSDWLWELLFGRSGLGGFSCAWVRVSGCHLRCSLWLLCCLPLGTLLLVVYNRTGPLVSSANVLPGQCFALTCRASLAGYIPGIPSRVSPSMF